MKRGRFSNEQIVRILRKTDQDTVGVVTTRRGVSDATNYIWHTKFGRLDTDEVNLIKALERRQRAFAGINFWLNATWKSS